MARKAQAADLVVEPIMELLFDVLELRAESYLTGFYIWRLCFISVSRWFCTKNGGYHRLRINESLKIPVESTRF